MRARKERRISLVRLGILAAALMLGIIVYAQSLESAKGAYGYVDQVLQLSQDQRGLDTGLTGRWDRWKVIMGVFTDGTFMVGRGIRSSDQTPIDNSYLVILYEIGLVPLVLITWRYFSISRRYFRGYFRSTNPEERGLYLACSLLLAVFLVNNIVARFLFSVGNPYSLIALLIFVTPAHRLATNTSVSKVEQKLLPPTLGARKQLLV